jgi:hypothetical protein
MNRLFFIGSIAWLAISGHFVAAQSHAARDGSSESIKVTVQSGRVFVAQIDPRTDDATLWLSYGTSNTTLLRPIQWQRVVRAEFGGKTLEKPEILAIARHSKPRELTGSLPRSRPDRFSNLVSDTNRLSDAERARRALGPASRVHSIEIDASLGNWDSDVESDGLLVEITPLDELGQCLRVNGVLHVTLTTSQRENSSRVAHGERIGPIGHWTVALKDKQWRNEAYVVQLPFQAVDPEFEPTIAAHGLAHVQLVVPGQGSFNRAIDGLRIRKFSPLRDQLERRSQNR